MLAQLADQHVHVSAIGALDVESLIIQALAAFRQTFVVVDALDECENPSALLPALSRLGYKLRLLVMSRDHEDIRRQFRGRTIIYIQPRDLQQDIDRYVRQEIRLRRCDDRLLVSDERIIGEIADALVAGAGGM